MYDKRKLALIYRIIIVIVSSIALFVNFKLMTFRLGILYFTNLSNLLCLLYFLVLVFVKPVLYVTVRYVKILCQDLALKE